MSSRRTRVAVLTHSATLGGAELGLLRYLEQQDSLDVRVLVLEDGPLVAALRAAGVPVAVPGSPTPVGRLKALLRLRREVASGDSDILLSNSMRAATLASAVAMPRRRHLYYLQDLIEGGYFSRVKRMILDRVTLPGVGAFLVNSEATRRSIPAPFSSRPAHLVYTVSGTSGLVPAALGGPAVHSDGLRMLSLSRIARWKGIHVLVEAIRGSSVRGPVTIAGGAFFGEDEYQREIVAAIDGDPRFLLRGHLDDVAPELRVNDVLLHCSITPEPFGQVIVQGMASGMVVIATRGGGPAEIVEDGVSGLLVAPSDPVALRDAIERVASDPELRKRLAAAAPERAKLFDDASVVARTSAAIEEFAGTSRR